MPAAHPARRRLYRLLARSLLLGSVLLTVFSIFFYTCAFYQNGRGVAMQSGRVLLVYHRAAQTRPIQLQLSCDRTVPLLSFDTFRLDTPQMLIVGFPLWVIGLPALLLILADGWMVLRARRDACFFCGYSLAGLPEGGTCPECGIPSTHGQPTCFREWCRALMADMARRTMGVVCAIGVLVAIGAVVSPFYAFGVNRSMRSSIGLRAGQLQALWYTPLDRLSRADAVIERTRELDRREDVGRHFRSGAYCKPTEPIELDLGWTIPAESLGAFHSLCIPLWWIAPPLMACGWLAIRRRPRVRPNPAPAEPVPSQQETA